MKKFIAIYYGSPSAMQEWAKLSDAAKTDRQKEGIKVWSSWGRKKLEDDQRYRKPVGKNETRR